MLNLITVPLALMIIGSNTLSGADVPKEVVESWIKENIGFEMNLGQVRDLEGNPANALLFFAKLPNCGIFITENGVSYLLYQRPNPEPEDFKDQRNNYARIDLELVDAMISRWQVEYQEPLPGYSNSYLPSCPDGLLGVVTYRKVTIKEVYPGIDWVWRYDGKRIHYEFEASPGADLERIKIEVRYADIELADDGKELILRTPVGGIVEGEVFAYENSNWGFKDLGLVDVSYRLDNGLISFDVRGWSGKGRLIIGPPLSPLWATYYGGSNGDRGYSLAIDGSDNPFVTGVTWSTNFPTYNPGGGAYFQGTNTGNNDAFISKFQTSTIGIEERPAENRASKLKLLYSPLFFNSEIALKFTGFSEEPLMVSLYSSDGGLVLEKEIPFASYITITDKRLQELTKGVYFLSVYAGMKRIVKAKLVRL